MSRLFQLLYRYRAFLIFVLFEIICYWLMVENNPYHSASFFHSSNRIAGSIYSTKEGITGYFNLRKVNRTLAEENANLRNEMFLLSRPVIMVGAVDSSKIPEVPFEYNFVAAKVINNSVTRAHNHFTLNKGSEQGVYKGMGVVSPRGLAGIVRSVSNDYATVYSLLNSNVYVSSQLKKSSTLCTVNWNGADPSYANILYVPRHISLSVGDSILTSGFNSVFPEKILVGVIEEFSLNESESFYNIKAKLATDFTSLKYVYVIENPNQAQKEELEAEIDQNEQQ